MNALRHSHIDPRGGQIQRFHIYLTAQAWPYSSKAKNVLCIYACLVHLCHWRNGQLGYHKCLELMQDPWASGMRL